MQVQVQHDLHELTRILFDNIEVRVTSRPSHVPSEPRIVRVNGRPSRLPSESRAVRITGRRVGPKSSARPDRFDDSLHS